MFDLVCKCGKSLRVEEHDPAHSIHCSHCGAALTVAGLAGHDTGRSSHPGADSRPTMLSERAASEAPSRDHRRSEIGPGCQIGVFALVQRLGAGAMGEVWLAEDTFLRRRVALKLLPRHFGDNPDRLNRFLREARLAAQLNHPHAMTVHHAGVDQGQAFIVMELIEGPTLEERVRREGALPWRQATRIIREAAAALEEAHRLGLVHRDIKPSNLMTAANGATKVVDFGLARSELGQTHLTQEHASLGTPLYMAPEQWKTSQVDGRADLYSLTCTYYFLLTGQPPFDGPNERILLYQHHHQPFPDAGQCVPGLPGQVRRVLARGSQKAPGRRYQTAAEMVKDLDAALSAADQRRSWSRRGWIASACAALVAVVALAVLFSGPRGESPPEAPAVAEAPSPAVVEAAAPSTGVRGGSA